MVTAKGDELVGSDEGAGLSITNILHLMPPLLYARSADVSDVANEGHHDGVASLEWYLYVFGQALSTRMSATPRVSWKRLSCGQPSTVGHIAVALAKSTSVTRITQQIRPTCSSRTVVQSMSSLALSRTQSYFEADHRCHPCPRTRACKHRFLCERDNNQLFPELRRRLREP